MGRARTGGGRISSPSSEDPAPRSAAQRAGENDRLVTRYPAQAGLAGAEGVRQSRLTELTTTLAPLALPPVLTDACARSIEYLRLSVTKSCGLRCVYCQPNGWVSSATDGLTADELVTLVRHLVERHGLLKVRLTGGEPTARPDLVDLVARLADIEGLRELALTTNGLTLVRDAVRLRAAGVQRLNVSLDSLEAEGFERITGSVGLTRVLAGLDAALAAGFAEVKVNTVVLRGLNDHELPRFVAWAAGLDLELRFIELMPMGPAAASFSARHVGIAEVRAALAPVVAAWRAVPSRHAAARSYEAVLHDGRRARLGFVAAMSEPFCAGCNRIRVGADGAFYPCLMEGAVGNVLGGLRPGYDAARLSRVFTTGLSGKRAEHRRLGQVAMVEVGG